MNYFELCDGENTYAIIRTSLSPIEFDCILSELKNDKPNYSIDDIFDYIPSYDEHNFEIINVEKVNF